MTLAVKELMMMMMMMKETFIKRYTVERTDNAEREIRPDEQSEKTESCRENLWNEYS